MEKNPKPVKVGQAVQSPESAPESSEPELSATEIAIGSLFFNPHPDKAQLVDALEKIHTGLKPFPEFDRVAYKLNSAITVINEM